MKLNVRRPSGRPHNWPVEVRKNPPVYWLIVTCPKLHHPPRCCSVCVCVLLCVRRGVKRTVTVCQLEGKKQLAPNQTLAARFFIRPIGGLTYGLIWVCLLLRLIGSPVAHTHNMPGQNSGNPKMACPGKWHGPPAVPWSVV